MEAENIIGIWQVKEIHHIFYPSGKRIPACDFKDEKSKRAFSDFRFVFDGSFQYRVYSDPQMTELCHSGKWYTENGCFYYESFITEGFSKEQLDKMSLLKLEGGELTVDLCLFSLFLEKLPQD